MFCPVCKAEYVTGITMCSDCNVKLVRKRPADLPNQPDPADAIVNLYSPINEMELAMIRSILDAEEIGYFVNNDNFGSLEVGPRIEIFNKKMIVVPYDQYERASELITDYLNKISEQEDEPKRAYSLSDKIRMAVEILLFGWIMPGRKNKSNEQEN